MITHLCALCSVAISQHKFTESNSDDDRFAYTTHKQLESLSESQWQQLCDLAIRHKVLPVMAQGIRQLNLIPPTNISSWLLQESKKNTLTGMKHSAELVYLTKLFEQHNIDFVCFKGLALCHLAGIEFSHRHSGDIDLLLASANDIEVTDEMLRGAGYTRVSPQSLDMNKNQRRYFLAYEKELVYLHPQKGVQLEVHFKLFYQDCILPITPKEIVKNQSAMPIGGVFIPIMNKQYHQLYLFVHGAFSRWFRLKWLCDIPLISNNGKDFCTAEYIETAEKLSIERMVLQGLGLSNRYLRMPLSGSLAQQIHEQPAKVLRLIRYATLSIEGKDMAAFSSMERIGFWFSYLFRYTPLLKTDVNFKLTHFKPYLTKPVDWDHLRLPSSLFWLYVPLRPFLWLKRYLFG